MPLQLTPLNMPLHRLLKRSEVTGLLQEFKALLPQGDLAVLGVDGRPVASTGDALPAGPVEWVAHVVDEQPGWVDNLLVQPLLIESRLAGALVMSGLHADVTPALPPAGELVLRCLSHSLKLLLAQALERRELVNETLERYREINLLYTIGETIRGCLDPEELVYLTLREAQRVIQAEAGWVLLATTTDGVKLEIKASFTLSDRAHAPDEAISAVAAQVYQAGQPAIIPGLPGHTPALGSMVCAPLKSQQQVIGVIMLARLADQPEFTAGDEKLLLALAGQTANAVETARLHQMEVKRQRLEEELTIGREIQLSLLPQACPELPGWDFAATYRPARQVGGDLYDFFELPGEPRRLGLVIADVTGKGVPAALFMAFSRTIIRLESLGTASPAGALILTNRFIAQDNTPSLFLSAFYATLDIHSGRLAYANGGHSRPLWLRAASGEVNELAARGIVLGAFQDIDLEEREIEVAPGDVLVFFTDGVTEAFDATGRLFGEERLQAVVAAQPDADASQILKAIIAAVEDFSQDTPPADDFTLFVVKRQPLYKQKDAYAAQSVDCG